jgi:hypothetical protein
MILLSVFLIGKNWKASTGDIKFALMTALKNWLIVHSLSISNFKYSFVLSIFRKDFKALSWWYNCRVPFNKIVIIEKVFCSHFQSFFSNYSFQSITSQLNLPSLMALKIYFQYFFHRLGLCDYAWVCASYNLECLVFTFSNFQLSNRQPTPSTKWFYVDGS